MRYHDIKQLTSIIITIETVVIVMESPGRRDEEPNNEKQTNI